LRITGQVTAPTPGLPKLASACPGLPAMALPSAPRTTGLFSAATTLGPQSSPMQITLKGIQDNQVVFYDTLFLEGMVAAPQGIRQISVNGCELLSAAPDQSLRSFLKEVSQGTRGSLAFSKLIQLTEGENAICVQAADADGRTIQKKIKLFRKIPQVRQVGSRLSVAICPFRELKTSADPLAEYVLTFLSSAFVNQRRFNVLERRELHRLLDEQKLSQESIFDTQTAVRLGRMMAAETIILGDIITREQSLEIVARMVDTESSLILAEKDIYLEGELQRGLKESIQGLALKFKNHFPMCEGSIIAKKTDGILVNLGSATALSNGMRLLAFTESDPVIDPTTGSSLGSDTDILAQLLTSEVHEKFAKTSVVKRFMNRPLEVGYRVITK